MTNKLQLEQFQDRYGGSIANGWVRCAIVAGQACDIHLTMGGSFNGQTASEPYTWRELAKFIRMDFGLPDPVQRAANDNGPVDIWQKVAYPSLPYEALPNVIAIYAKSLAEQMGADSSGVALACLTVCASAIPDSIRIKPKIHAEWVESCRIWTALVGCPSAKKTPIINAAIALLETLDTELVREYLEKLARYNALEKSAKAKSSPPAQRRFMLSDTTIESAVEALKDNPQGLLVHKDELSGWFGQFEKYGGGAKGAAAERAVWLQAWNGGPYSTNRITRGVGFVPNLSVSIIGGIQPDAIRKVMQDSTEDGLIQRLFPIILRDGGYDKDVPLPSEAKEYNHLIRRLTEMQTPKPGGVPMEVPCRFSPEAQEIWYRVSRRADDLRNNWQGINRHLAFAIGKYNGLYARLCLLWNCIETTGATPPVEIAEDVASRVEKFLFDFLYPHGVSFYTDMLGLSDRHDALLAVADWILVRRAKRISVRDAYRSARKLLSDKRAAEEVLERLEAFGWLTEIAAPRGDSRLFEVDNRVHEKFTDKAEEAAERKSEQKQLILETVAERRAA